MAIRQASLQASSYQYSGQKNTMRIANSAGGYAGYTKRQAFLSHSHLDSQLVKGLIVELEKQGVQLYVDWQDNAMPDTPNQETARRIQDRIKANEMFLFLATKNAKQSRWCPWELGYADSAHKQIYIIPTTDGADTYGNEYLQLYSKIDQGELPDGRSVYATFEPNAGSGSALSDVYR